MEKDPKVVAKLAEDRLDENWRFRMYVKQIARISNGRLNALAERLGREAETQMDCTECGTCCRAAHVPVSDEEIETLARRISLPVLQFRQAILDEDDDRHQAIDANPCPFLEGNICTVYGDRPSACRDYPYIGGDVRSRMIGIIERAGTCPIIFEMLEQLKSQLNYHRYR